MSWLLRHNWLWSLLAFLLGAAITWFLLVRREHPAPADATVVEEPVEEKEEVLVGAAVGAANAPAEPRPPRATDVPPEPDLVEDPPPVEQTARVEPTETARETRPVEQTERVESVGAVEETGRVEEAPAFSRRMEADRVAEPTLFDHAEDEETDGTLAQVHVDVPPGRYGEGSADAVPHQGPPDGFTIKGNATSMLFHTPDSPYYGRTKPQVWFRTEADAERAGFTKYTRRPRKSTDPRPQE
ncbi:sunset domain-containing protein [Kribbella swartbergensis]